MRSVQPVANEATFWDSKSARREDPNWLADLEPDESPEPGSMPDDHGAAEHPVGLSLAPNAVDGAAVTAHPVVTTAENDWLTAPSDDLLPSR